MSYSGTSPNVAQAPIEVARTVDANMRRPNQRIENQTLVRQFELAIAGSQLLNELLAQIACIVCEQTECLALWIAPLDEQGKFSQFHPLTDESAQVVWETVSEFSLPLIQHVRQSNQIGSIPLPFSATSQLVAAPLRSQSKPESHLDFILLGAFDGGNQTPLRLQWLMGLATQAVTNWFQSRTIEQIEIKQRSLSDALRLILELDQTTTHTQAAIVVVNQLRRLLQVEQVALSIDEKLLAISDIEQIDHQNESNRLIQSACNQTMATGEVTTFFDSQQELTPAQLALETYCRSVRIEACINLPLKNAEGATSAALLIAGSSDRLSKSGFAEYLNQLTGMMGGHLDVVLRANRGLTEIATAKIKSCWQHSWRKPILWGLAGLVLLMAIPMPYRIHCDCELQPVLRRFVAAPYEGVLERTLVQTGDLVKKNQLLARLDGRNLRIELVGLQAELGGAKKRRDSALATGDIAHSQIARSEAERLTAKIELLEQRTANLEVRSPIAGIVVSGDLEKVEGAPLEMGQTLFEIAPLNQMVSEIAIPESEIPYAASQLDVGIKLNAFPFQTWTGQIQSIHPRTELIDNNCVFIAQVLLSNENDLLRPGMKGSAKIRSGWAPLGWNLFHRPWESLRYWMIW